MLVGYTRMSTQEQNLALQLDALKNAGCDKVFVEKASGAQRDRPEIKSCLSLCESWRYSGSIEAGSIGQVTEAIN